MLHVNVVTEAGEGTREGDRRERTDAQRTCFLPILPNRPFIVPSPSAWKMIQGHSHLCVHVCACISSGMFWCY